MSVILYDPDRFETIARTLYRMEEKFGFMRGAEFFEDPESHAERAPKAAIEFAQDLADMNAEAYRVRYDEEQTIALTILIPFDEGPEYPSVMELFKSLKSIRYNCYEALDGGWNFKFKPIMDRLTRLIGEVADFIASHTKGYLEALGRLKKAAEETAERIEEARGLLGQLADYLKEAHQEEIDHQHFGDHASDCSYCRAIRAARRLVRRI